MRRTSSKCAGARSSMSGLQAGQQVGCIRREIGKYGEDFPCLIFVVGMRNDIPLVAIIKPALRHPYQTALCADADYLLEGELIKLFTGRKLLLQLALEHLERQFIGVFKPLDTGVADIFVTRHGTAAVKHPLERA